METNVLKTIKLLLGIAPDYTEFDEQILININNAFAVLWQLGVGPDGGFVATGDSVWSDFTDSDVVRELLKNYVYYRTRLSFDPPQNGTLNESLNKLLSESEYRLRSMVDWGAPNVIEHSNP